MLIKWLITAVIILALAYILPGIVVDGFFAAVVAALVLGLINSFLKPIIVLFTLPINVFTLGLFTLVINAVLVMLASAIVPGFSVGNFWWALLFSIILSITNSWVHKQSRPRYHSV
ncbi:MAG: phage holin family protein [Candidatus Doudnabacteria bacterium]|nr:phage holin family protein [Candidatus Doudnabacteria bacterium]